MVKLEAQTERLFSLFHCTDTLMCLTSLQIYRYPVSLSLYCIQVKQLLASCCPPLRCLDHAVPLLHRHLWATMGAAWDITAYCKSRDQTQWDAGEVSCPLTGCFACTCILQCSPQGERMQMFGAEPCTNTAAASMAGWPGICAALCAST